MDDALTELLVTGLDDWLDAGWLVSALCIPEDATDPPEVSVVRPVVTEAVRTLLQDGLVEIGDLEETTDGGLRFLPWNLSVEASVERVLREWEHLGRLPTSWELFWLQNTDAGSSIARDASPRLRRSGGSPVKPLVGRFPELWELFWLRSTPAGDALARGFGGADR